MQKSQPAWKRMMDADTTALHSFMNEGYAPPDWEFQHALEAYTAAMRVHHHNGHQTPEPREGSFRILGIVTEENSLPGDVLHRRYGG